MIVPRSAQLIDSDDEFTLYAVTTFRKHSAEFTHKCRESKWTPRDFKYKEGGREEEQKEIERVGKDERKVWNEALRLGRTAWGEAVMAWVHVLTLRVFVETVLRYGLPLQFVCGLIRVRWIIPFAEALESFKAANISLISNFLVRLQQNLPKKHGSRWMSHIHILEATHLDGIRRVGSRKMTLQHRQICKQQVTWAMGEITPRTCAMNSRSSNALFPDALYIQLLTDNVPSSVELSRSDRLI